MQLDFQQFIVQVDKFISIKPIPGKDLVENFIKAYYLTEVSYYLLSFHFILFVFCFTFHFCRVFNTLKSFEEFQI